MRKCPEYYSVDRIKFSKKKRGAVIGIAGTALVSVLAFLLICTGKYTLNMLTDSVKVSAATSLSSITSDSIKEKENQISQAQNEIKQMENNLSDLQTIKKNLESQKSDLQAYVKQLDSNLADIEAKISELNIKISTKEEEIATTEKQLADAQEREQLQKDYLERHVRMMYERSDSYIIEMLAQSESFHDFLNRADYIELVTSYDYNMWEAFIANRQYIELCKEELDIEKEILDKAKESVEAEQANLESLIAQKNKDITAYETDISNKEQAIKEYEDSIKQQNAEIKALEDAIAEEKKSILASNGTVLTYDGGVFKFPLASYTRVSDDYGNRIHPTLGVEQFHNGVDFAAPKGTAIYAAYDGEVVAATYSSTMGNYVMINHGDGLYTIYMHASALYVNKGDIVARGDTIAAVGSTGRSTGNHLHFSVRKDGAYVSPWNYISQ
jgi:murein DD-endopeptidase MepM/ murein hydrolase activator NlpD